MHLPLCEGRLQQWASACHAQHIGHILSSKKQASQNLQCFHVQHSDCSTKIEINPDVAGYNSYNPIATTVHITMLQHNDGSVQLGIYPQMPTFDPHDHPGQQQNAQTPDAVETPHHHSLPL